MPSRIALVSLAALLAGVTPARAQTDAGAQVESTAPPAGQFATMDRGDHESRVGLFLALLHVEDTDLDEGAIRMELHGQVVGAAGLGGYLSLPLHFIVSNEDDEAAVGGIEVGGLVVRPAGATGELVGRVGLVLPTASSEFPEAIANVLGAITRITDYAQVLPETVTLRASGSWLSRSKSVFSRIDLGIDAPLATTSDEIDLDRSPFVRLNGAVGVEPGAWSLALEVVNLVATDSEEGSLDDRHLINAGVTFASRIGSVRPYAGLYLQLDSMLDDDFEQSLVALAAGAAATF